MNGERAIVQEALPAYELGGELGRGAWGVVYAAEHRSLGRRVAVKQLPRAFAAEPAVRDRFVHEARTAASLDHPHVVGVYDFVEREDGLCLIIMERCDSAVSDRFQSVGLATDEACAAVLAATAGLAYAHERALVHRDIKPANLLYDDGGLVKLADFGMVRALDEATRLTATGTVVGTPAYMAPEQAEGDETTPASDVYSMAIMLYEFLSGDLPFEKVNSVSSLIRAHLFDKPRPLSVTGPHVPPGIGEVIDRALRKPPGERYADAGQFGVALAAATTRAWGPGWLRQRGFRLSGAPDIIAATERDPGRVETADVSVIRSVRDAPADMAPLAAPAPVEAAGAAGPEAPGDRTVAPLGGSPSVTRPPTADPPPAPPAGTGTAAPALTPHPSNPPDYAAPPAPGHGGGPPSGPGPGHDEAPGRPGPGGAREAGHRKWVWLGAAAAVVVALVAAGLVVLAGGGDDDTAGGEGAGAPGATQVASADGMVPVAAGTYPVGTDSPDSVVPETPSTEVPLDLFYLDTTEVTNDDYARFVAEGADAPLSWSRGSPPEGEGDHPVQGVPFGWASAYCGALGKRLPTEAEWEVAARGGENLEYAWGDDASAVDLPTQGTYPAGSIVDNRSPSGAFDMTGSVWEWVNGSYDDRIPEDQPLLKGGQNGYLRTNYDRLPVPDGGSSALAVAGFRCAATEVGPVAPGQFGDFEPPASVPEVPDEEDLPPGVLLMDDFSDPTTGWIEEDGDGTRYGYHPNEYFHLETTGPGQEVVALAPADYRGVTDIRVSTSVFVAEDLTDIEAGYQFGLVTRLDESGGVSFLVDPNANTWQVIRGGEVVRQGSADVGEDVELSIEARGENYEFSIGRNVVTTANLPGVGGGQTGFVLREGENSGKVHMHYDSFLVEELE